MAATAEMINTLDCKGRVLIISEGTSTSCLAESLEGQGYNCTFVDSDNEAEAILRHKRFDLILYSSEVCVVVRPGCCLTVDRLCP